MNKLTPTSQAFSKSFNEWIQKLDDNEIKEFTIFIFNVFYSNNQRNIMNLRGDLIKSAKVYLTSISKEDKQVKNDFHSKCLNFIKLFISNLFYSRKLYSLLRRRL